MDIKQRLQSSRWVGTPFHEDATDAATRIEALESALREITLAVAPTVKSEGRLSQGLSGALIRSRSLL